MLPDWEPLQKQYDIKQEEKERQVHEKKHAETGSGNSYGCIARHACFACKGGSKERNGSCGRSGSRICGGSGVRYGGCKEYSGIGICRFS